MRGENLREFRDPSGEVDVRLAFREDDKQSIEQLADLPLYTPDGRRITLGSVANMHIGESPDTIRRTDRQTAVIISANLEDDVSLDEVRPRVEQPDGRTRPAAGLQLEVRPGLRPSGRNRSMMTTNLILGIACIFLVMAALFESTAVSVLHYSRLDRVFDLRCLPVLCGDRHHVLVHGDRSAS